MTTPLNEGSRYLRDMQVGVLYCTMVMTRHLLLEAQELDWDPKNEVMDTAAEMRFGQLSRPEEVWRCHQLRVEQK